MSSYDEPRPPTPTHHPTHGVHMSFKAVQTLCKIDFPERKLVSMTTLPPGRSFNNRIYFLKTHTTPTVKSAEPETEEQAEEWVLKVNGHVFGADKVQNEVSCLRLLEEYCPDIPVPRFVAWSEDGVHISKSSLHRTTPIILTTTSGSVDSENCGGWIIMSRMPGEPISDTSSMHRQ